MRNRLPVCGFIAAVIAAAGACGNAHTEMNVPQTELTAAETAIPQTGAITDAGSDNVTVTETVQPADAPPDKLYADEFADERFRGRLDAFKAQNEEFMRTNRFIDYKFIYSPEQSDIPADVQDRAMRYITETDAYRSAREKILGMISDGIEINYADSEFYGDEDINDYFMGGEIFPKFVTGWENDFDGDGKTERFLAVTYPCAVSDSQVIFPTYLIFESSGGEMSVVDHVDYLNEEVAVMLDYGDFKQFYLSGHGFMGASEHTTLLGVVDGECRELYASRIWFYKQGCFLSYTGWMGICQFMIFDTQTNEYRHITGYPADIDKIKLYDTDDVIPLYMPDPESKVYLYYVIGGRFLYDSGSGDCYRYENGKFTKCEYGSTDGLTIYPLFKQTDDGVEEWFDVDIAEALEKSGAVFGVSE